MSSPAKAKRYALIMDRNVDDRFSTSMLMQQFGYNTCTSATADETLEFLCVAPPAFIVAEGGAAGSVLLQRMQKDQRFADVPVILLSPFPDRMMEERARKGELAGFLRKPVDVEAFYRVIQETVEKGPRRNIRIATSLRARLGGDFGGAEGLVSALSAFGLFFRTLDPPPVNTRVPVSIEIKGRTVRLEGQVLYAFTFDEGPFKEPGMGLKFVRISPEDQAFIKDFILERIKEEQAGARVP